MIPLKNPFFFFSAVGILAAAHAACSPTTPSDDGNDGFDDDGQPGGDGDISLGTGGGIGGDGDLDIGGDGDVGIIAPNGSAFPAAPVLVGATEADAGPFADPNNFQPGSVCVHEPHLSDSKGVGALFPENWLRPRFRWTGTADTWEIRLSAESQGNDLVVYTKDTQWIMPKEMWDTIAKGVPDEITVTIRGNSGGTIIGQQGTFRITPALAGGSMVFWGTSSSVVESGSSRLYGFSMGDEAVVDTLRAEQVTGITNVIQANGVDLRGENESSYIAGISTGAPRCIGCHNATPDGLAMAFTDDYPWNMGMGSVEAGSTGAPPAYLSAGARELMKIPFLGTSAMLPLTWNDAAAPDRTMITTMGSRPGYVYINYSDKPVPEEHELIWIDLETNEVIPSMVPAATGNPAVPWPDDQAQNGERIQAAQERETAIIDAQGTAWGTLYRETGGSISNPAAAKTSLRLAYSVSESSLDGHPDWHNNTADIKVLTLTSPRVSAGASVALAGASDPGMLEYYPAFSPDDAFIAFNQAPAPTSKTRCKEDPQNCTNNPANLGANPDGPYYNRNGEIAIVPSAGGTPHRLRANDPVECSGEVSPGVTNSWPKWSSAVREIDGSKYYFVIFSSTRAYEGQFQLQKTPYTPPIDTRSSQLYMSVVQVAADGTVTSYAPIYLWNQNYLATGPNPEDYEPLVTANLTPAWEDFSIPEVPPVTVIR